MPSTELLETLIMDPEERRQLAVAVAEAIAATPRPAPSAAESAQRTVSIVGGAIGVLGVLVAAAGWAFNLQATVGGVASDMAEIRESTGKLSDSLSALTVGQWSRTDQERFESTTVKDLEARVRALEARSGTR